MLCDDLDGWNVGWWEEGSREERRYIYIYIYIYTYSTRHCKAETSTILFSIVLQKKKKIKTEKHLYVTGNVCHGVREDDQNIEFTLKVLLLYWERWAHKTQLIILRGAT